MTLATLQHSIHALGTYSLESVKRGAIPYIAVVCISVGVDRCARHFFPKIGLINPSLMELADEEHSLKQMFWIHNLIQIVGYGILKVCHIAAQAFLPKGSICGINASTIAALMLNGGFHLFLDIKFESERKNSYNYSYWFFRDYITDTSIDAITLYCGLPVSILMGNLDFFSRYYLIKHYLRKSLP